MGTSTGYRPSPAVRIGSIMLNAGWAMTRGRVPFLQPELRLGPLLATLEIDADPRPEIATHRPGHFGCEGVPQQGRTPLDELVDLRTGKRPCTHIPKLGQALARMPT